MRIKKSLGIGGMKMTGLCYYKVQRIRYKVSNHQKMELFKWIAGTTYMDFPRENDSLNDRFARKDIWFFSETFAENKKTICLHRRWNKKTKFKMRVKMMISSNTGENYTMYSISFKSSGSFRKHVICLFSISLKLYNEKNETVTWE